MIHIIPDRFFREKFANTEITKSEEASTARKGIENPIWFKFLFENITK